MISFHPGIKPVGEIRGFSMEGLVRNNTTYSVERKIFLCRNPPLLEDERGVRQIDGIVGAVHLVGKRLDEVHVAPRVEGDVRQ